jgi:uncharacterized protein YndB with AHSA1/START domain
VERSWELTIDIAAPADATWGLVGDPTGVPRWFTKYEAAEVDGDTRVLRRADGGELVERLLQRDESRRFYAYGVIAGAPVSSHQASFEVQEAPGGSRVIWRTTAEGKDPEMDMEARLAPSQREGLERMKQLLEGTADAG